MRGFFLLVNVNCRPVIWSYLVVLWLVLKFTIMLAAILNLRNVRNSAYNFVRRIGAIFVLFCDCITQINHKIILQKQQ